MAFIIDPNSVLREYTISSIMVQPLFQLAPFLSQENEDTRLVICR